MVPVRLTGSRLAIREYHHTPGDVDALHALFGDPEVTRYLPFDPWDRETCADQIELYLEEALARERRTYQLAVTRREDAEDPADATPIAHASLTLGTGRRAELGYAVGRGARGRGHAGEVVGLLCGLAFGALGLRRLTARVDVDNRASAAVLTRLGFRAQGPVRHDPPGGGVRSGVHRYALTTGEWAGPAG
ncbi:GNAT family N-acetyltransferase [Kitasatospora sp. NPDC051705]|uniref:GNAT family N-acetyltransferase n=1 Tax=Kitasatospora sp. NPDC051705 TaxID=3364057 RepID=UPI003793482A